MKFLPTATETIGVRLETEGEDVSLVVEELAPAEHARDVFLDGLRGAVRRMVAHAERLPSVEDVASKMGISPRTLRRRLADEGTTFAELSKELRQERAVHLLRALGLSTDETAERLGYSSGANFIRAFRRWTGVTPSEYKRMSREAIRRRERKP